MSIKLALLCCLAVLTNLVTQIHCLSNGEDAKVGEYPYYVSLYYKDTLEIYPVTFCGGAILNNRYVLTAAYCTSSVNDVSEILVKAGSIYARTRTDTEQISNVTASFRPNEEAYRDDIALLKLETPLNFNEFVSPIHLPKVDTIPTGEGTVSGLGSLKRFTVSQFPETLQTLTLPIITNDECQKLIDDIFEDSGDIENSEFYIEFLNDKKFCTGPTEKNQGYCMHDTGDPFVIKQEGKDVIAGIASFGFATDCDIPDTPSIYTRVSAFNEWINETINENE